MRESEVPKDGQADRRDRGEEDRQDRGAVQLKPAPAVRSFLGSMSVSVIHVDIRFATSPCLEQGFFPVGHISYHQFVIAVSQFKYPGYRN